MGKKSPDTIAREQLMALRTPLIELHRLLLESERRRYESVHGRVSAAELLQLAVRDNQFQWLHQISTIIVHLDTLMTGDNPPDLSEVSLLAARIRALLKPSPEGSTFEQYYDRAVQEDPAILLAHRRVMQALPAETDATPPTIH